MAQGDLRALHDSGSPAAESLLARLRHIHDELVDAVDRFRPDGQSGDVWMNRYGDGRPVIAAMPMDEAPGCYVHCWHPDPAHPMNNPCELDVVTNPDGSRKRVIVSAPGHLDAVPVAEGGGAAVDLGLRVMSWPTEK